MKELFDKIINFLAQYDFTTLMKTFRQLQMDQVVKNPVVWIVAVPFVAFCLFKRQIKYLVIVVSLILFLFLVSNTLPEAGETISADKLVKFVAGAVGLIGVNFYLLFVRDV
jgi:hypothetical protein